MEFMRMFGKPGHTVFSDEQIAQRSTWAVVPNDDVTDFALHTIHQIPLNASTCTYVNPTDPDPDGWRLPEHDNGRLLPAGNM